MNFAQELKDLVLATVGTLDGKPFQEGMKENHPLAMEYMARLLRRTTPTMALSFAMKSTSGCRNSVAGLQGMQ